ncbi:MAG: glycosyltransferase family 4 protein [Janthinobacterium lividum]
MEKLRILLVTKGVMTNILGVLKVHYDLKEEYEKQGHLVDVLDFSVIYPNGISAFSKIFGEFYTVKFWKYLKKNSHKYDVIDANNECIIYPKESFGFKGVLLARSHGIMPVYAEAENIESYKKALTPEKVKVKLKTRIGNIYRALQKRPGANDFFKSIQFADWVHCLNKKEYQYFLNIGISTDKLLLIPNSLPDNFTELWNKESTKDKKNSLCFIGSWTVRKGIKDFDNIITIIREKVRINNFLLLGGHYNETYIKQDFKTVNQDILQVVSSFKPEELSSYLNVCKVGLFPSYVEGFGLAVIEQLAFGVPVVAYKVPGPTDILESLDSTLLIEPGNHLAFAKKVIEILELSEADYTSLAERCKLESRKYLLSGVSKQFVEAYISKLNFKNSLQKVS